MKRPKQLLIAAGLLITLLLVGTVGWRLFGRSHTWEGLLKEYGAPVATADGWKLAEWRSGSKSDRKNEITLLGCRPWNVNDRHRRIVVFCNGAMVRGIFERFFSSMNLWSTNAPYSGVVSPFAGSVAIVELKNGSVEKVYENNIPFFYISP